MILENWLASLFIFIFVVAAFPEYGKSIIFPLVRLLVKRIILIWTILAVIVATLLTWELLLLLVQLLQMQEATHAEKLQHTMP